jgi:hypothetical protein
MKNIGDRRLFVLALGISLTPSCNIPGITAREGRSCQYRQGDVIKNIPNGMKVTKVPSGSGECEECTCNDGKVTCVEKTCPPSGAVEPIQG